MATFMERAIAGEFADLDKAISDAIAEWHSRPDDPEIIGEDIYLFLGMTWKEYAEWVQYPSQLAAIIVRRRS